MMREGFCRFVPGCVLFGEFFLIRPGVQRDRSVRDGWLLGGLWWSTAVMQRGCETQAFTPGFSRPYSRVFCVLPLVGAGPFRLGFVALLFGRFMWRLRVGRALLGRFVRLGCGGGRVARVTCWLHFFV